MALPTMIADLTERVSLAGHAESVSQPICYHAILEEESPPSRGKKQKAVCFLLSNEWKQVVGRRVGV